MSKLKIYKFSSLYEMSSGISSKPEQAGHGSPFVSFKTVFNNHFLPENLNEKMDVSDNEKITYSVKKGDIFLTRTSESLDELAMSCVVDKDYVEATFSGFLKRLRPTQDDITYHRYMAFYLRSKLFRKTMTNNAIMTLRASFNEQIFSYLDLVLPQYNEQKAVGDFLYAINQKIELNNKINAELEAMAKTLYDYWFVQFDFPFDFAQGKPNADGKPYKSSGGKMVYHNTLKREIPDGWEVESFKNLEMYQPQTISEKDLIENGEYFVYGANGIIGKYDKFNHEDAEILITCRGNSCGNILESQPKSWITGNAMIIRSDLEEVSKEFLFHMLHYSGINRVITGSGQPQLTRVNLETLHFIKPTKVMLKNFNEIVNPITNKKQNIFKQNQELATLRDWLLPMLMNGQVTVDDTCSSGEPQTNIAAEAATTYQN